MNPRLPLLLCLVRVQLEKVEWSLVVGLLAVGLFTVAMPLRPITIVNLSVALGLAATIYWPRGRQAQNEYESTLPISATLIRSARLLALVCGLLLVVGLWGCGYYHGNIVRLACWLGDLVKKPNMCASYGETMLHMAGSPAPFERNTGTAVLIVAAQIWYSTLGLAVVLHVTRWWRLAAMVVAASIVVALGDRAIRGTLASFLTCEVCARMIVAHMTLNVVLLGLLILPRRARWHTRVTP